MPLIAHTLAALLWMPAAQNGAASSNQDIGVTAPRIRTVADEADSRPAPPLLREGSVLRAARGRLRRDEVTGWWWMVIETVDPAAGPHELIMLPNAQLEAMQRDGGEGRDFDVSGSVFEFKGRNFLLATSSSMLIEPPLPEPTKPPETPNGTDRPETDPAVEGDTVEDIMRELSEAVGPLPVRPPTPPAAAYRQQSAYSDGRPIVSRRGWLTRTNLGAWVFVHDADAEGSADPPLIIMPCRMLERLARNSRRRENAPILISGQTYAYQGRGYLLPTSFRAPRERTMLHP